MKLDSYERKFLQPPEAGNFRPLTVPHQLRNQKKGDGTPAWVKLQTPLIEVLYGKTLQPSEKVFAMILYDQLFHWSNKRKGQPDTDHRCSLVVSTAEWAAALGLDPRTAKCAGISLHTKGIVKYEEICRGLLRLSFVWNVQDP